MDFNGIISRIDNYLHSNKGTPIIVDVQTRKDLSNLVEHYETTTNKFVHASKFCEQDGVFKIDEFKEELSHITDNVFISGLSSFLKLDGEKSVRDTLKSIVTTAVTGHVIILTFQCKNYLKFSDSRIKESGRLLILDGEPDSTPSIVFISPSLSGAFNGSYTGFNMLPRAIEECEQNVAYIATSVDKNIFPNSLFSISQLNSGYDIICSRDTRVRSVPQSFGTPEQWNFLLELMEDKNSVNSVVDKLFGSSYNLSLSIRDYCSFDDKKRWIYYIFLCIFGVNGNNYLKEAINVTANSKELIKSIFRTIILFDFDSQEFASLYNERKLIISNFTDQIDEFVDYCKVVSQKEKDMIYYLTDSTQVEKEKIISYLDKYGYLYSRNELISILNIVYPDLAKYLFTYKFRNDLLDPYIDEYKYQKVINRIIPSFESVVDDQAIKHDFISKLKVRSSVIDKIDVNNSQAYFVDALGVEYLGYILSKCNSLDLSCNVTVCRANLPTLTSFNKDFVETFESKLCKVTDIKGLDEIKHNGKDDFDYEKVKTPIYLIKELSIIDDLIKKIKTNLSNGSYQKAIIISDHGTSRLAVIHETENIWSMASSGEHSGRCCPISDIDVKPDAAIEEDNYFVLANYDRFKGGRKANVEVHGGASIEEVTVPIIEITIKQGNIEAFVTEDSKVFTIYPKEIVTLKIFVGTKQNNIGIELNGNYYEAEKTENDFIYKVKLPDITKKGIYKFNIMVGNENVAINQRFEIKKKGMSENDLF